MAGRLPELLFSEPNAARAMANVKEIAAELIALAREQDLQPLAVFDVDETLLLNHEDDDSDLVARNPPVFDLHEWLRERGVSIFVVTARRWTEGSLQFVRRQLEALGYEMPAPEEDRVYMVNAEHDQDESASLYKLEARRKISRRAGARPHSIILNVGDQASDHMLVAPYNDYNAKFARRHLAPEQYHAMVHADGGVSKVSVKLPERYTVA